MTGEQIVKRRILRSVFLALCTLFLGFTIALYSFSGTTGKDQEYDPSLASEGRLVWQRYNCQACHQLYGLGGYLGPDLTNLVSMPGRDEVYLKAIIGSGNKQMPGFLMREEEMSALLEFLRSTNMSGIADPRSFSTTAFGTIENGHEASRGK